MAAANGRFTTDANVARALEFYARATAMTAVGEHEALVDELPSEIDELARITQGLLIYDVVASDFYGCELTEERQGAIHIRPIEELMDGILALDERPLSIARPPDGRLAARCHHYARFLVAILRAKGIPARVRVGFGAYFNPGRFEDHMLCEYWSGAEQRWLLVDPQFDEVWRARLGIEHDHLDVPRTQFIVAAEAWEICRNGAADPALFGIDHTQMYGLWFIAGSLIRDIAALNKVEVLPWDVWGAQPRPDESLSEDQLALFDELAALARDPDESLDRLRERYEADDRLQVPATVFNALLGRREAI
jgi:Transglutaminase-like superfamily